MKVINQSIPANKMQDFHDILCATGGRYLQNPYFSVAKDKYIVSYEPGDYKLMSERFNRVCIDIIEVREQKLWRKLFRKYLRKHIY